MRSNKTKTQKKTKTQTHSAMKNRFEERNKLIARFFDNICPGIK